MLQDPRGQPGRETRQGGDLFWRRNPYSSNVIDQSPVFVLARLVASDNGPDGTRDKASHAALPKNLVCGTLWHLGVIFQ